MSFLSHVLLHGCLYCITKRPLPNDERFAIDQFSNIPTQMWEFHALRNPLLIQNITDHNLE